MNSTHIRRPAVETLECRRLLAATPALVADLNTAVNNFSPLAPMVEVDGVNYFFGRDPAGLELWRTDGTDAGTFRVKDVNPGPGGLDGGAFFIPQLVAVGGVLYFGASDGVHGTALWRSDGTEAGTTMVYGTAPGPNQQASDVHRLMKFNDGLLFYMGGFTSRLWESDGTAAGTRRVASVPVDMFFNYEPTLLEAGGTTYFVGRTAARGYELWKSTGGIGDAVPVKDLWPGPTTTSAEGPLAGLTAVGDTLYFTGDDGVHGYELWKSDGTAEGTVLVTDLAPGAAASNPRPLCASGGQLVFASGPDLYTTDGTAAGTVKLVSPNVTFRVSSGPARWAGGSGGVFFLAVVSSDGAPDKGMLLWTDGTPNGTRVVKDLQQVGGTIWHLFNAGGRLYFTASSSSATTVWTSDGTDAGTVALPVPGIAAITNSGTPPPWLGSLGTTLFIQGRDPAGEELWRTDGTVAGTARVNDLYPGTADSNIYRVAPFGDGAMFVYRGDLYQTRADSPPAPVPGAPRSVGTVMAAGGAAYFTSRSPTPSLLKTDGTAGGTVKLADVPGESDGSLGLDSLGATASGRTVYFHVGRGFGDGRINELWKSDGTTVGTAMGTSFAGNGLVNGVTAAGETVFFIHNDRVHGYELWKSDGTAEGTGMVTDLRADGSGAVSGPIPFGNKVLFGGSVSNTLTQLFVTDGTAAGTVALGPAAEEGTLTGGTPVVLNGAAYFAVRGATGTALWRTDGTVAGTAPVNIPSPANSSLPVASAGRALLLLSGTAAAGYTLWRSDGTADGTQAVATFQAPTTSSAPWFFGEANGVQLFRAYDAVAGEELWQTDGTAAGTWRVADIFPGARGSYPLPVDGGGVGDTLYFTAIDPAHGRELWRYTPDAPPAVSGAWVSGSAWSAAFVQRLQSQAAGSGTLGAALTAARPLPWANMDRISLRFSGGIEPRQGDLRVTGADGSAYAVAGFAYDPQSRTATWTLARPLDRADRVTAELSGSTGWSTRFDVLPGDVNGNGAVLADDFSDVKRRFFTTAAGAGDYSVFCDVNGSGSILAEDFSEVRARFFQTLPAAATTSVTPAAGRKTEVGNRISDQVLS